MDPLSVKQVTGLLDFRERRRLITHLVPLQNGVCVLGKGRLLDRPVPDDGDTWAGEDVGRLAPEQRDGPAGVDVRVVVGATVGHFDRQYLLLSLIHH